MQLQSPMIQQGGPNLLQQPGTVITNSLFQQTPGINPMQVGGQNLQAQRPGAFPLTGIQASQPLGGMQQGSGPFLGAGNQQMQSVLSQGTNLNQQGLGINQTGLGLNQRPIGLSQSLSGMGQQGLGMSQPLTGLGQQGLGMNQPGLGMGQQGLGMNQPGLGMGQQGLGMNQPGLGMGQQGLGMNQQGLGMGQQGLGMNQPLTGLGQQGLGMNQQGLGLGQQGLGMNQPLTGLGQQGLGMNQQGLGMGQQGMQPSQPQLGLTGLGPSNLQGQQQIGQTLQQPGQQGQLSLQGQTQLNQQQQHLQQQQVDFLPTRPNSFAGLPIYQQSQQAIPGMQQSNMLGLQQQIPQQQLASQQQNDNQINQTIQIYVQNIYSQINPLDIRNRFKIMLYNMRNEFDPPIQNLQSFKQTFVSKYDNPNQQLYYCDSHLWQEAIKNNKYSLTNYPIQINSVKELFQRYEHTKQMRELQLIKEHDLQNQIRSNLDFLQKVISAKQAKSHQLSRDINEKFIRVNKLMEQILMAQGKYRKDIATYNDVLKKNSDLTNEIGGIQGLTEQISKFRVNLENIILSRNTANTKDDLQTYRQLNSQLHIEIDNNSMAIKNFEDQVRKLL